MTIKQILENGVKVLKENYIDDELLKSKILLCYILNVEKEYLIIHDKKELSNEDIDKFNTYINRLINREPLQYITNKQEFMGLEFYVDKRVLIPQPDTEILAEEAIKICKNKTLYNRKLDANTVGGDVHSDPKKEIENNNIKILDLCTGSGAIGISIAKNVENCEITLSDISTEALKVANKNSVGVGFHPDPGKKIQIIQSDLFENIHDKFDIIVSNPPYIKTDVIKTLEKEVQNEPMLALDGGKDGLRYL